MVQTIPELIASQACLNLIQTSQMGQWGPRKAKKHKNWAEVIAQKDRALLPKPKLIVYMSMPKKSHAWPKKGKKGAQWA